jgi:hypothetical protein
MVVYMMGNFRPLKLQVESKKIFDHLEVKMRKMSDVYMMGNSRPLKPQFELENKIELTPISQNGNNQSSKIQFGSRKSMLTKFDSTKS